jgi:hypothetical protein
MTDPADIIAREAEAVARLMGGPAPVLAPTDPKPKRRRRDRRQRPKTSSDTRLFVFGDIYLRRSKGVHKPDGSIEVHGLVPTGELSTLVMLAVDGAVRTLNESKQRDHGLHRITSYRLRAGRQRGKRCLRAEVQVRFERA